MKRIALALTSALVVALAAPHVAHATGEAACSVAEPLLSLDFPLPRVSAAIKANQLNITVVGSTSSTLPDANGPNKGYPWRLETALSKKLPGVTVKVTTYAKARETADGMQKQFARILASDKPALVIWQTGTVEAMRRVDLDHFRNVLEEGIDAAKGAGADVILMNMQYSPRTELLFAAPPYADAMRIVALQHEVPLFDRLSIMRHWGELGTFDFNEVTRKIDTAARVHDCIGRLLARQIVDSTKLPNASSEVIR